MVIKFLVVRSPQNAAMFMGQIWTSRNCYAYDSFANWQQNVPGNLHSFPGLPLNHPPQVFTMILMYLSRDNFILFSLLLTANGKSFSDESHHLGGNTSEFKTNLQTIWSLIVSYNGTAFSTFFAQKSIQHIKTPLLYPQSNARGAFCRKL